MSFAVPTASVPENKPGAFFEEDVTELPLYLPSWQATALERTAHSQGLTAGQLLRGIVQDFFARFAQR
jgi:hypothetical protein